MIRSLRMLWAVRILLGMLGSGLEGMMSTLRHKILYTTIGSRIQMGMVPTNGITPEINDSAMLVLQGLGRIWESPAA